MKKSVNLFVSNTYLCAFESMLAKVKETSENLFENNIVVVPDRFALNAEKMVFEKLNIESSFNIEVITLSRLVEKTLKNTPNAYKVLSKQSGIMLVSKIVLENAGKLKTYHKLTNDFSFAESMFNTINLFKSSGIKPEEVLENADNTIFGEKLKDIHLIYSEYENALKNGYVDAINKLQIFNNQIKVNDYIKNSNVYFGMFDSFTNEQYITILELSKSCKSVSIALVSDTLQKNKNIYDNSIFQTVLSMLKENNMPYQIFNVTAKLNPDFNFLANNLFAPNNQNKYDTNSIKVYESDNVKNEINFVASQIKALAISGVKFDQIAVAVNNMGAYEQEIKNIFTEYTLPFYIDNSKVLSGTSLAKYISNLCEMISNNFMQSNVIEFVKSKFEQLDKQKTDVFENFCYKYAITSNQFLSPLKEYYRDENYEIVENVRKLIFDKLLNLKKQIDSAKTIEEYALIIQNFITEQKVENTIKEVNATLTDETLIAINDKLLEKVNNVFNELIKILGGVEVPFKMFADILNSGFESTNVGAIPQYTNTIFVGDSNESTFYPCEYMFMLGCTNGDNPVYSIDAGVITDAEINKFKSKNHLSPSIRQINKRALFKLFNLVLYPSKCLFVSYSNLTNGEAKEPSELVLNLKNLLTHKNSPLCSYKIADKFMYLGTNKDIPYSEFGLCFGTTKQAVLTYLNDSGEETNIKDIAKNLFGEEIENYKKEFESTNKKYFVNDAKNMFFDKNYTKVSQIERYYSCPFKQFVDYGLKLKENERYEIKPVDVGNILHQIAEVYVNKLIEKNCNMQFKDNKELATKCFELVIVKEEYMHINKNQVAINSLKQEAIRFCDAILYHINNSDFKPTATEFSFKDYEIENGLTISGKVDRVDEYISDDKQDKYFKIVDYKTGKDAFNYKDLYYGKKIQLLVYLKALTQLTRKIPVAATYFPVKNSFSQGGNNKYSSYKMSGVFLNNEGIIKRIDKTLTSLNKSEIINVSYKADGTLNANTLKVALTNQELTSITDYSIMVLNQAVNEMLLGYIEPKPYFVSATDNACLYCKYRSICLFNENKGYRLLDKITSKENFKEKENE